ncbi:MAG: aryl-sulfate sulfotransferase [Bacteroidales bacterium]|nr:aryl-sulfate sulfotransferase [Bacteroidales bacterium]
MRIFTFTTLLLTFFLQGAFGQQWGDYTLYSVTNSTAAYLVRHDGSVFHSWTFSTNNRTGYSSYLLPGGELLRTVKYSPNSFTGGGQSGKLQKVDWDGNILWDFVYSTTAYAMHHDVCPMPNGNVLLIAYEVKTAAEATQAGSSQAITIWSEKIVEVQQTGLTTGEIVWEWHLWDHLVQNHNPVKDNYVTSISEHPERLNINYLTKKDWIHMNGVEYNPILDQITFSSHNLNEIYVIDHSTTTEEAAGSTGGNAGKGGDFLYRWGNPPAYQRTGARILNVVHDSHWIPEGVPNAGRLVAFNNKGYSSTRSSVDQINPPLNGYNYDINGTEAWAPLNFDERHACNGYSSNMSSSQQLPNGNALICMATSGLIYEIDPAGTTIWTKQVSGQVAKAWRYSECYVNNPLPPMPEITESDKVLYSTSGATYQWYRNGQLIEGATNQSLEPEDSGIYLVRITNDIGCHMVYSKGHYFDITTTIKDIASNLKSVFYPNPTTGILNLTGPEISENEIEVFNMAGKSLMKVFNSKSLDLSGFPNGIYLIKMKSTASETVQKIIISR